jgi:hypothetical protein
LIEAFRAFLALDVRQTSLNQEEYSKATHPEGR